MVNRTCKEKSCGIVFKARLADIQRGWGQFCSKRCKAIAQMYGTDVSDSTYLSNEYNGSWDEHEVP
jgi:hypothetical protein